ncbi:cyclase family protein [Salinicoccus sp. YB14-2]|uniref:cyclase family protein n=1 Tax=Salinicoccus sp. YB14-2 TaxID=1572701 RepID=UPI00068F8ED5|nr:cyclase family protein [Salinicoccus sp. YB14-2]
MTEKYVDLGYPIYEGMPVFPGLPEVKVELKEDKEAGDHWNGSVLTTYLHAGTHVDAPFHHFNDESVGIDSIPAENFVYDNPLVLDVPAQKENDLITIDQLEKRGDQLYEADMLIFNTHAYKKRNVDFEDYSNGFSTVSPEAAEYIRAHLPKVKAVAIDTLSIENIPIGKTNNFRTHKAFLNPSKPNDTILIYEDVNLEPIVDKTIRKIYCTPLRIVGRDASICNPVAIIEE